MSGKVEVSSEQVLQVITTTACPEVPCQSHSGAFFCFPKDRGVHTSRIRRWLSRKKRAS